MPPEPVRGLRLTPGKAAPLPEGAGSPVPWFPRMYYLSMGSDAGKTPLHEAGAYYLQEPSAAVPPAVLAPKPGERVLDDTEITLAIYVQPGAEQEEGPSAENDQN